MFESKINRGRANGYAPLDGSGKVPLDKLPPIQSPINTGSFITNGQTGSFATTGSNVFSGNQTISGSLLFGGGNDEQTLAYAGGNGHQIMIDTNRTDDYTENGSADKPYKTLSSAITAANIANPNGTDPYTFVMKGCNIDENISFNGTAFNFITLATTSRTVINGTLTITDNPNLKQLIIRNLEFAQAVTITGDGTAAQMNNMSFYNTSFSNTLNVTCVNSLALWDVYSSAAVNLTNLHYLYVGGGQITGDVTIVADSTQTLPSGGMSPGQSIVFDLICNNLIFTKGGSASYVFQPHNTRIGLNAGSYTIPSGFTVSAQASTFRGTWTNNGSLTLRNSSTDNTVLGTQPTYTGTIGGTFKGVVNSTNGVISGSSQISGFGFATTGSNTFVGNQIVSGTLNIATNNGDEGGEILLGKALTNTTIAGNNVIVDVFKDRVRIFEDSGSNRGAFLNIVSQSAGVTSEIVTSPNLFSIQTITSASYASLTPVSGTLYVIID
jgi:hypothetical protein